jgi:hypothetical protein
MAIWNILRTLGIFYDHLVHFVFIGYIFPVLVSCSMKNLATLALRSLLYIKAILGVFSLNNLQPDQSFGLLTVAVNLQTSLTVKQIADYRY